MGRTRDREQAQPDGHPVSRVRFRYGARTESCTVLGTASFGAGSERRATYGATYGTTYGVRRFWVYYKLKL